MTAVKALQDDCQHWYLIPNELVEGFDFLSEKISNHYDEDDFNDLCSEFDARFGEYRTGGDLNRIQLYIK